MTDVFSKKIELAMIFKEALDLAEELDYDGDKLEAYSLGNDNIRQSTLAWIAYWAIGVAAHDRKAS